METILRFKNLKHLCEVNGWSYGKGNTRKALITKMNSKYIWHKEGNSIVIDKVLENSSIVDKRTLNSKYQKNLEQILLHMLNRKDNNSILKMKDIIKEIDIFNENFLKLEKDILKVSIELELDFKDVRYFYYTLKKEITKIIERTLESMSKKNIITFEKITLIRSENGEERVANEYEMFAIEKAEIEARYQLGCSNKFEVFQKGKRKEFECLVKRKLIEGCYDTIYYPAYRISNISEKNINQDIYILAKEILRNNLNKRFYELGLLKCEKSIREFENWEFRNKELRSKEKYSDSMKQWNKLLGIFTCL